MSELEKFHLFSGQELRDKLDYEAYAAELVATLYDDVPVDLAGQEPALLLWTALQLYFQKSSCGLPKIAMLLAAMTANDLHPSRWSDHEPDFRRDVDALACFFDDALRLAEQTRRCVDK